MERHCQSTDNSSDLRSYICIHVADPRYVSIHPQQKSCSLTRSMKYTLRDAKILRKLLYRGRGSWPKQVLFGGCFYRLKLALEPHQTSNPTILSCVFEFWLNECMESCAHLTVLGSKRNPSVLYCLCTCVIVHEQAHTCGWKVIASPFIRSNKRSSSCKDFVSAVLKSS